MKKFFKKLGKKESYVLTDHAAEIFAEKSGPLKDILKKAVQEKDYQSLVNFCIDYSLDWDAISLYCARQCLALYQKRDDIDLGYDREQVALSKFIECELICKHTNERVRRSRRYGISRNVASVLFTAQRKIDSILGDVPSLSDLQLSFGPGANVNVRKITSARWKLSAKPACSANMASSVCDVLAEIPHYTSLHSRESEDSWFTDVEICDGELMFVPKNAKTDRAIIVEPALNSLVQKGFGNFIKERLLIAGVNLYDQSINRRRARIGSINGSLMTVDLSSASDTISKELVAELLPLDWYIALSSYRTSSVEHLKTGTKFDLEKFSSMGNGFTFELESLIFYALTWATCHVVGVKPDVSVYGDDIICPPSILETLEEVFEFCGFSINSEKSYSSGPFRESCGADFYNGVNVRPFYQKTSWSYATLTAFHNFLVKNDWSLICPEVIEYLLQNIDSSFHNYGPDGYGDGHLIGDFPVSPYGRDRGWSGYTFTTYIQKQRRVKGLSRGDSVLPHYVVYLRMSDEEAFNPYVVRGESGEKRISVYTLSRF